MVNNLFTFIFHEGKYDDLIFLSIKVRHLAEHEAAEALFARLSYQASVQAEQQAYRLANRLTPGQTARLSLTFCLMVRKACRGVLLTLHIYIANYKSTW